MVTNSDTVLRNGNTAVFALLVTRCLRLTNIYTDLFLIVGFYLVKNIH